MLLAFSPAVGASAAGEDTGDVLDDEEVAEESDPAPRAGHASETAAEEEGGGDGEGAGLEADAAPLPDVAVEIPPDAVLPAEPWTWDALEILGAEVRPGEKERLVWAMSESFTGVTLRTPVVVARGRSPGPSLCLTAGVHGDEINGIEAVRRTMERIDPEALHGTVLGVPIVNLHGFRRSSRYLPDRRDLNRFFPGRARGSSASRIAFSFFQEVVSQCDLLVDMHTGSFHRTNVPQVRANFEHEPSLALARGFGTGVVVNSVGTAGTLRRAANDAGIGAITYEVGEPMHFRVEDVEHGVAGVENLMSAMNMLPMLQRPLLEPDLFARSLWVRADAGGILVSQVPLGAEVEEGDLLGTVTNPVTNGQSEVLSPFRGRVVGMALNQVVIPGFAAYHLAIRGVPPGSEQASAGDWGPEAIERSGEMDARPE